MSGGCNPQELEDKLTYQDAHPKPVGPYPGDMLPAAPAHNRVLETTASFTEAASPEADPAH
jgi:hypothetical protein